MSLKRTTITTVFCIFCCCQGIAQEYKHHYIGILPSILAEPYDTINAIEVNILPLVYEYKFENDFAIQIRPVVNYRFFELGPGISQTGGTIMVNKYLPKLFSNISWLTPQIAAFHTYTYNQIDKINTLTFGIEPGVMMTINEAFSMNLSLQPGINYYPDEYSKTFVKTDSGFKSHFGILFHIGYHF